MKLPSSRTNKHNARQSGFTLLTCAFGIVFFISAVGLAVDIGRIYIAKSETQTFVDSASLAATLELDGTDEGIDRARARVISNPNRWDFDTQSFSTTTTSFAKDRSGPWVEDPGDPAGYRYARAVALVDVPIYFLSIFKAGQISVGPSGAAMVTINPAFTASVQASSGSGQELKTRFKEGLFPFSPFAHDNTAPDFGLIPGQLYTLRWASNPKLGGNVCAGDDQQVMIDLANAGGGSERGFIEESSASNIRDAIVGDYQTAWRGIGDSVIMTGGAKQTQRDALLTRIAQDSNSYAPNYTSYVSSGTGNGRRVVGAPVNTGSPDYRVVQIGAFFLRPEGVYDQGGNSAWCAEYIGPWVQGSDHKGASTAAGAYVVRLTD